MIEPAHSHNSTLRERIVEHVFIGDMLRLLWRRGVHDVDVLRPEFDAHGYDLVMTCGQIMRHIQFKTGTARKPGDVSVARALAEKPSGCVVWIHVDSDLAMGPFFWFGAAPGQRLPSVEAYQSPLRATHNKAGVRPARVNHRLIPGKAFTEVVTLGALLEVLFGDLPGKDDSL